MTYEHLVYTSPTHEGRHKSKRERAADLINQGRKLAKEALEEENAAAEKAKWENWFDLEYGSVEKRNG